METRTTRIGLWIWTTLVVLFLQHRGFRYVEALVVSLIVLIASAFTIELWLSRPSTAGA